ncbi:neutral zinc metallopeptidase family protein [Tolypothrix tenuis PCC 7101]|uniref:Neutral zinc metallopeptidase family protein n=1 Tax=Tolypothrix tenuis PCC 7101 TaxID=231146 RepID=A0A1Z4MUG7_9CYAN|nr:neutral zinc metallopeptidase [Aulosira sp. FACHB-113]BAY97077.1 neutral zinc metallopeptidase family protein [Tolypothrix tenuis PCC 7101]BAZ72415.1 neutral zinc metallopeptidase family protein [Aulosira laxa NIES-50]
MRWEFGRRSTNVEDRRGTRISAPVVGGGIGAVILSLIVAFLGGDPSVIWEQTQKPSDRPNSQSPQTQSSANSDRMADFVSVVLADTEDTWSSLFQQQGKTYREPTLVLYSDAVESACGFTRSAVGPFYCPSDQKLYIDLSFYQDLKNRYQAPGDFAQAYVIAHEVGHHVQNLMGISQQVRTLQRQADQVEANQLSVRQELQADCFAGVWAYHADRSRQILESGDIEEALNAASSIGDDRLQSQARGYVIPESFTHGSSAQRVRWFKRGIQTGNPEQCNTFRTTNL